MIDKARKKAFVLLTEVLEEGKFSNLALKKGLEGFSQIDKSFITALVYGTIDKIINIDYVISLYARGKVNAKVKNILRLGAFQVLYMDKVPDSAAVNTSVELAKDIGKGMLSGFINGVLRNVSRNKQNIPYPKEDVKRISVKYSYPEFLVAEMIAARGVEATELACKYEGEHKTCLRFLSKEKMQEFCAKNESMPARYFDECAYISGEAKISAEVSVQSESSLAAVKALSVKQNENVLDCCAAPGGKTVCIAQALNGNGKVKALDKYPHRVELIKNNAKRCNVADTVEAFCADMTSENDLGLFDKVLVDAPCSGLGVVDQKPEIKLNITPEALKEIEQTQIKILQNASKHVKSGGVLVYSTCTVRDQENIDIVKQFLQKNKDFYLDDMTNLFGTKFEQGRQVEKGFVQLYPEKDLIDGFFISRMKRI